MATTRVASLHRKKGLVHKHKKRYDTKVGIKQHVQDIYNSNQRSMVFKLT